MREKGKLLHKWLMFVLCFAAWLRSPIDHPSLGRATINNNYLMFDADVLFVSSRATGLCSPYLILTLRVPTALSFTAIPNPT